MTASVITFANQHGTDGNTVARTVAEQLQYRFYDWEIIWQAASEAGVSPEAMAQESEHVPSFIERILTRLAVAGGDPEESPVPAIGPRMSMLTSEDYRRIIEHVVRELADQGDCVIIGHAGQAILREKSSLFRVLLFGSPELRAKRLAKWEQMTPEAALEAVKQHDSQRLAFFKRAYKIDWLGAVNYDLAFNTDHISTDLAVKTIVETAHSMP